MASAAHRRNRVFQAVLNELAPYPGRPAGSLRDTLSVSLVLMLAMTLHVPGVDLTLAFLFFLQLERPRLSLREAFEILLGMALCCVGVFLWVQVTDGSAAARFIGIVLVIFGAAFGKATTRAPLFCTICGLFGYVDLALWDEHRSSIATVTESLYYIASVALVIFCGVVVQTLFAPRPRNDDPVQQMREHLMVLARFFQRMGEEFSPAATADLQNLHSTLVRYVQANFSMSESHDRGVDRAPELSGIPLGTRYRIDLLTSIMEKATFLKLAARRDCEPEHAIYRDLARTCDRLRNGQTDISPQPLPENFPVLLREIHTELQQYAISLAHGREREDRRDPITGRSWPSFKLFLPGAFQSADSAFYALKLTLAATVCYVVYNAIAWPGISTCVITVLFTGLSTTGAMKQIQLFRICGAAIGGVLGILTVSLLFPNMDSITSLVVVVAPIAFLSSWVLRSAGMGYMGMQIALGFCLTALPGFGATNLFNPARDRVVGVGLGILVMWFVFDQLWPVRISTALDDILRNLDEALRETRKLQLEKDVTESRRSMNRLRRSVFFQLAELQRLQSAIYFDVGPHYRREMRRSRKLVQQINATAKAFYLEKSELSV
jgi:multidrug resistance protein MdtO